MVGISILIPVYNVEGFVEECINSIISQIDEYAEIILMNDGSTDGSREVLEKFVLHSQISIYDAPCNRGLSATRNALLSLANYEYIWFIDSDDVMHQGAYREVSNALSKQSVDVLFGDYMAWKGKKYRKKRNFIGNPNRLYHNYQESFFKNIVKTNSNFVWCKIYRKSIIDKIDFQVGKKFEDIYYMADLSAVCQTYAYIDYPLIDYRERDGSIVRVMDEKSIDDFLSGYLYAVEKWQSRVSIISKFQKHPDQDFIFYKTYSRFASMMIQLDRLNKKDLLARIYRLFVPKFEVYKQQVSRDLGFIAYYKFKRKIKVVERVVQKNKLVV